MVEKSSIPTGPEVGKNKVELTTSFSCPYCNSGAEKYSELFNHGTCVNCGGPLEQFNATLTEKGAREIKQSFLFLYSKEDKNYEEIIRELEKSGVNVIDIHDIIDGSKTSVVSANLAFVMNETAAVLVAISEHLEDNAAVATCLGNAIVQHIESDKKVIPIFTKGNEKAQIPFGLTDIVGVNWNTKLDLGNRGVEKSRMFPYLKELASKNS